MKRTEHRYEFVVSGAVLATFAAFWLIAVVRSDVARSSDELVQLAVNWAVLATPSAVAARLLWRAWWARTGARLSTMDGPAQLLAAAAAMLPDDRRDWGTAMVAELAQVRGRSSRWRFAVGCARAALSPARRSRGMVLVVGAMALAAVMIAGLAVGDALPAMRVFAATFVALVGGLATVAVARPRRVRQAAPGPTIAIAGVAGVATCIAVIGYFVVEHPSAAEDLPPSTSVILALVLAAFLWLALTPPRTLTTSRLARRLAVGAALTLGLGFVLASRFPGDRDNGVAPYLIVAPVVIFFLGSALAATHSRSFHVGVEAAVWTTILGSLVVFVAWLEEASHWYHTHARLLLDGETGSTIGENLGDATLWTLVFLSIWGLPFGVIGAAVGSARWRRRAREISDLGPQQPNGPAITA